MSTWLEDLIFCAKHFRECTRTVTDKYMIYLDDLPFTMFESKRVLLKRGVNWYYLSLSFEDVFNILLSVIIRNPSHGGPVDIDLNHRKILYVIVWFTNTRPDRIDHINPSCIRCDAVGSSIFAAFTSSSSPFTMTFEPNTVRTTAMRFFDNHEINMVSLNLNSITLPAEQ